MSWSPELPIGEFRPWPDTVHVVRGRTGETLRYVPEQAVAATLGPGTCEVKRITDMTDPYEYAPHEYWRYNMECGGHFDWDEPTPPEFCPNCGRKVERGDS